MVKKQLQMFASRLSPKEAKLVTLILCVVTKSEKAKVLSQIKTDAQDVGHEVVVEIISPDMLIKE